MCPPIVLFVLHKSCSPPRESLTVRLMEVRKSVRTNTVRTRCFKCMDTNPPGDCSSESLLISDVKISLILMYHAENNLVERQEAIWINLKRRTFIRLARVAQAAADSGDNVIGVSMADLIIDSPTSFVPPICVSLPMLLARELHDSWSCLRPPPKGGNWIFSKKLRIGKLTLISLSTAAHISRWL